MPQYGNSTTGVGSRGSGGRIKASRCTEGLTAHRSAMPGSIPGIIPHAPASLGLRALNSTHAPHMCGEAAVLPLCGSSRLLCASHPHTHTPHAHTPTNARARSARMHRTPHPHTREEGSVNLFVTKSARHARRPIPHAASADKAPAAGRAGSARAGAEQIDAPTLMATIPSGCGANQPRAVLRPDRSPKQPQSARLHDATALKSRTLLRCPTAGGRR